MRVKQQHIFLAAVLLLMSSSVTLFAQGDTTVTKNTHTYTLSEVKKELPKYKVYSPKGEFIGEYHQTADNLQLINFMLKKYTIKFENK